MKSPCKMIVAGRHLLSGFCPLSILLSLSLLFRVGAPWPCPWAPAAPHSTLPHWQATALVLPRPSSNNKSPLQTNSSPHTSTASRSLCWPCALKRSEFQPKAWKELFWAIDYLWSTLPQPTGSSCSSSGIWYFQNPPNSLFLLVVNHHFQVNNSLH